MRHTTLLLILLAILLPSVVSAQEECGAMLDRAAKGYEMGQFQEVIDMLSPCVQSGGFNREEEWQAYRLLALAYLFSDRIDEAEEAINEMLRINPRYEPNPSRDPAEFIKPFSEYTVYPRFSLGVVAGMSMAGREMEGTHGVVGSDDPLGEQAGSFGNDLGLLLNFNLDDRLALSAQIRRSLSVVGSSVVSRTGFTTDYTEHLSFISLPLSLRYNMPIGRVTPFVSAGYFAEALLSATSDVTIMRGDSIISFANDIRSTDERRRTLNHGVTVGAGIGYSVGGGMLQLQAEYQHGLAQLVETSKRYGGRDLLFNYLHVDDDFSIKRLGLSLGFVYNLNYTAQK